MNCRLFFKTIVLILSICKTVHLQNADLNGATTGHSIPCEDGWMFFGRNCYKAFREGLTWEKASARCVSFGGHLASIHSQEEQDFITTFILLQQKNSLWIGFNDLADEGNFVWTDGTNVDYKLWSKDEPSQTDHRGTKEDCAELLFLLFERDNILLNSEWNVQICSIRRYFICKKKKNEGQYSPDPVFCSIEKGGGWKFQGACYNFVNQKKSWYDAEQYCKDNYKGHLVTISDWETNWFINYIQKNFTGSVWIGMKLRDQLQQKWTSGWHVSYNLLSNDFPEKITDDICVLRSGIATWDLMLCNENYPFICESSKENPVILKNPLKGWECPGSSKDWRDLDGEFCYYFNTTSKVTWFVANAECTRRGGTLASIPSQEVSAILKPFVRVTQYKLFIGLNSLLSKDSTYTWTDSTSFNFKNWNDGEPNRKEEGCVELLTTNMKWNDVSCDATRGFICSARKVPPSRSSSEGPDESQDGVSTNIMTAEAYMHQSYCWCFPL